MMNKHHKPARNPFMFRSRHTSHPVFVEDEFLCRRPRKRFRLRYLLMAALGLLLSAWAYQRLEASVVDKEVSLDDVAAGQLLLKSSTGKQMEAVSQNSSVHIKVSGMVAHVSVQQRFRNQTQEWVEGVYAFPLPDKAAVNRMRMVIGQRVIEGQVKEKVEAKKVYEQARAAGKKTGLVKQQRPNLFTTQVANIGPNETITVQLDYIETVAFDHGQFSLRFPMTITPRYIPGVPLNDVTIKEESLISSAMGWATATDEVPDASDITPWLNPKQATKGQLINPVTLTAELDMGMPLNVIESAYHNIVLSRQSHRYDVRLREGSVSMNQDFVLTWQPQAGSVPKAAVFIKHPRYPRR
jgi:Ca-activated chloride channel family protein